MRTFGQGLFEILVEPETRRRIAGQIHSSGRLGIYRAPRGNIAVTHIPTGMLICRFDDWKPAKEFVRAIADMDWDFQDPMRRHTPFFAHRVNQAIKRCGGWIHQDEAKELRC